MVFTLPTFEDQVVEDDKNTTDPSLYNYFLKQYKIPSF